MNSLTDTFTVVSRQMRSEAELAADAADQINDRLEGKKRPVLTSPFIDKRL